MDDLVKLELNMLQVGKPLPWPVYDGSGKMLLTKGYVVTKQAQLQELIQRGVYRSRADGASQAEKPAKPKELDPFTQIDELAQKQERLLTAIRNQKNDIRNRLKSMLGQIQKLCAKYPDPCIGAIHLRSNSPPMEQQYLYHAILCELVGRRLNFDDGQSARMIIAALTANLSLYTIHDKLNQINAPLNSEQLELVQQHPEHSVSMLQQAGIMDDKLAEIVIQHHEQANGEGYPAGLSGEQLLSESKLLSIAEHYIALVTKRAYRNLSSSSDALREVYRRAGHDSDERVYMAFIKELSVYPPGTMVKLANQEIAIVTQRPKKDKAAQAKAIISPRGGPYMGGYNRDCGLDDHKIAGCTTTDHMPKLDLRELWGYKV